MTVELVGREISWNFGETTATGGLFTRGSVRWKTRTGRLFVSEAAGVCVGQKQIHANCMKQNRGLSVTHPLIRSSGRCGARPHLV